jgi:hypothetical protein
MDAEEKYFELLLSEKHHADSAIGGYADLHVKLFGFFGVGITLLGWLYGEKGLVGQHSWPTSAGIVALALAVISCGIVVHGVSTYALTLGYIQYKNEVLNPEFQALLALPAPPLRAVTAWAGSTARRATVVSSLFLFVLHKIVACALLTVAAYSLTCHFWPVVALFVAWSVLLFCIYVEFIAYVSITRVLVNGRPSAP